MASLQKSGEQNIIRPSWLIDCIKQNEIDAGLPDLLLPFEPRYVLMPKEMHMQGADMYRFYRHMFFMTEDNEEEVAANVDKFMDSYARDTTVEELKDV